MVKSEFVGAAAFFVAIDDIVDEYVLLIHPLVLGSGRRLFVNPGPGASLRLVSSSATPEGVLVATYEPKR